MPSAQVQQRAATLLLSVEASPLPDSSSIRGTASALAKLLSSLGAPLMQTHLCCVRATCFTPLLHGIQQDCASLCQVKCLTACQLEPAGALVHIQSATHMQKQSALLEGFVHLQVLRTLLPRLEVQS